MEISATRIRIAPLERHRSDPLPKITFNGNDDELKQLEHEEICKSQNEAADEPEMTPLPEVVYGMMPRMAWMCRLMERAGAGTSRSARATPWFDNERDVYQHHAEYLKRLSKLREELINQEQSNLANALERLRMRSYGREFVYSRPQKDKKVPPQLRHSAKTDINPTPRNPLLTTFEKFQRMRPKKTQAPIMPLEGKSLIDTDRSTITDRSERHERNGGFDNGRGAERSVDESVRINLQRLTANPIASIPRTRRSQHRDIVLESSSFRRQSVNESNNSNAADERMVQMQKQKQKLMKLRQDTRDTEKLKLQPQSFRLDTLNDEDRMNLEKLKDYYCVYYVPAPASSPAEDETQLPVPFVSASHSNLHIHQDTSNCSLKNGRTSQHSHRTGYRVVSDAPIPPTVCDGSCRMYVSGNKVEAPFDRIDFSINKIKTANKSQSSHSLNGDAESVVPSSRGTDRPEVLANRNGNSTFMSRSPPGSRERMRIRVDMPAIVYNNISTPDLPSVVDFQSANLTKAFKQKELRHKELTNLIEDVRELNQITETLSSVK